MPSEESEPRGDVGEAQHQQDHQELDQERHEEQTREVDEADDVDGELRDDQEDPSNELQQSAPGENFPGSG